MTKQDITSQVREQYDNIADQFAVTADQSFFNNWYVDRAQSFNWNETAKKYVEVYRNTDGFQFVIIGKVLLRNFSLEALKTLSWYN